MRLRDRKEDIPLLVRHFVRRFCARHRKPIARVPDDLIDDLQQRQWPGNIRELQNVIERAVIATSGNVLRLPVRDLQPPSNVSRFRTLRDAERAHIAAALQETNGVVAGWNGAAARLGLSRTTLIAKMQSLGLSRIKGESARVRRRRTTTRGKFKSDNSEELFDHVHRSFGANLRAANGKQLVQEGILRFGGFEARQRPKVGRAWRSVIANALERHMDEGTVVGLQRDAHVKLDDAVRPFDRPVVAAGQHFAAKPLTLE
jgi:hypothetical protein